MTGANIRTAQRAIDRRGVPVEIVRADEGYHYFIYDVPARNLYETVSTYEPYTSHRSAESWADIAEHAYEEIKRRVAEQEGSSYRPGSPIRVGA